MTADDLGARMMAAALDATENALEGPSLAEQVERGLGNISDAACQIAVSLEANEPIGLDWQPGDGTRYPLAFFPIDRRVIGAFAGRRPATHATCVVLENSHVAYSFDLTPGGYVHHTYIAEKLSARPWTSHALALLFNAVIAERERLRFALHSVKAAEPTDEQTGRSGPYVFDSRDENDRSL